MQLLLLGSDSDAHAALEAMLRERGHTLEVCVTLEDAWAVYERARPPMIVLSHVDEPSLALSRRIRDVPDANTMIVAIPLSGCSQEHLKAALEAGVDDCIGPPADQQLLATRFAFVEKRAAGRLERVKTTAELRARVEQQAVVAEIGRRALAGVDPEQLMAYAAQAVADALDVEFCQVLERTDDAPHFLLRASAGPDGAQRLPDGQQARLFPQAQYTLRVQEPTIVEDIAEETRFDVPPALKQHGVVSGISVVVDGADEAYGVLCAHAVTPRDFSEEDIHFLQSVANVLAGAVERVYAERALRESEAKARAIVETTVDGVITIDAYGCIESFNEAAETIFGYEAEEVIGRNVKVLMPAPYKEEHDGYMRSYRETGRRKIIGIGREVRGRRKDGTTFPLDLAVSEVQLGKRRIFTGIVRDITERRRLEKKILNVTEQERRRIGQDLHDGLGQMLTGIGLLSQNLTRQLEQRDVPEAESAAEITELVKDADQYARDLARGLTPVDLEASGLVAALQRLVANAERLFDIECVFEEVGSALIYNGTAATHMYRIAQEAVSNAVRHGKASRIKISLASGSEQVRLRIQDNGVGFPDEEADDEGEGMGVRIMNYRARIIGGTLEISSSLDSGTIVTCTLPRTASIRTNDEEVTA